MGENQRRAFRVSPYLADDSVDGEEVEAASGLECGGVGHAQTIA
jgi:hypothetical protein